MSWKSAVFKNFKLYGVTAIRKGDDRILEKIDAAYRGGADIIQLRSKELSFRELYELGLKIRKIADSHQKLLFVNDRPDLALMIAADGIHLGQDDIPLHQIRPYVAAAKPPFWIGKSTHSLEQARAAIYEGADYIGVGPIFETPTKPDYLPVGIELIRQVAALTDRPFVTIGGINAGNLNQILEAGAKRVAVVRALFDALDPAQAAKEIREKIERYHVECV